MQTGDGLLARLRIVDGRVTPDQLATIARLARTHGNGVVEISARGNLQIRGLSAQSAPALAAGIEAALSLQTGLVIDLSPIAGEDPAEKDDPRPLAAQIRKGSEPFSKRLSPKVSVVIDSGGQISLASAKADIRLLALGKDRWAVTLGGGKPQIMDGGGATSATLALLSALAAFGPDARAVDLFPSAGSRTGLHLREAHTVGRFTLTSGFTRGIALPFSSIGADALGALAETAMRFGIRTLRLAYGHALLIDDAPEAMMLDTEKLGFITDPDDARLKISACVGSAGCASGHIDARTIAAGIAATDQMDSILHVSGCAKGCAHPARADVTLVGLDSGIGLVIDGRAGDTPRQIVDEAGIGRALAASRKSG